MDTMRTLVFLLFTMFASYSFAAEKSEISHNSNPQILKPI